MTRSNRRRGTTLVELCIVMALVAIVGTSIASFSVMISSYTGRLSTDRDVKDGLTYIDLALDVWVSTMDSAGATLSVSNSGSGVLTATVKEGETAKSYTLQLTDDGFVVGTLPGDRSLKYAVTGIKSLSFLVQSKGDNAADGRVLVTCRVTHEKPFSSDGLSDTTTLMRTTRVGEVLP